MIYLLLSILCTTAIYAIFSLFARFKIDTFQAIVVNYFIASSFGFIYARIHDGANYQFDEPWLFNAVIVGLLFISLFYLMAITSQKYGLTITGIATKMSMIVPAIFFLISDPEEGWHLTKVMGIGLGMVAVVLTTAEKTGEKKVVNSALIPIVLFIGSGLLDLFLAITEKNHLTTDIAYMDFVPVPFSVAATLGVCVLMYRGVALGRKLQFNNIVAGLVLGLINYGSIYFLLKILGSGLIDRSSAIPANNMGVVALSAIVGYLIFKERLGSRKTIGIVLALISILLLTFLGA